MRECVFCRGVIDQDGDCYLCDADKIRMKYEQQGGDVTCRTDKSETRPISNAAPTFNPKGCGIIPIWSGIDNDPIFYVDEEGVVRWKAGLGVIR